MNNHAPRSVLKVDSTCIKLDETFNLIIYNINIPAHYLQDRGELTEILERVRYVLIRDFSTFSITYQITASYILKHSENGQQKTWCGSFFARNNVFGVIAGFQQFLPNFFVGNSLQQLVNIDLKLSQNEFNTKWKFDELLSVIFNIQCKLPRNQPPFANRRHREHVTFPL